jgi:hypothetical protein
MFFGDLIRKCSAIFGLPLSQEQARPMPDDKPTTPKNEKMASLISRDESGTRPRGVGSGGVGSAKSEGTFESLTPPAFRLRTDVRKPPVAATPTIEPVKDRPIIGLLTLGGFVAFIAFVLWWF